MSEFWQDRSVLVTGATGLVGSRLVYHLVEEGADVVSLVRDWVPESDLVRSSTIQKTKVVRGDICDLSLLERIMGEYEVSTIIHLAAQTIVPIANRNPVSTFEANIKGTWSVLEAARRSETIEGIVLASSDKAYGDQETLPYDENMPLMGRHPYDVSKSCADLIAQSYANTYDSPVVITRCGNFYGPGDLNWSRIVPGTIRSVIRETRPVIRSDGNYIRDYFYVEDGARAYMHVAQSLIHDPGIAGEAFNFSNESQITVLELVTLILRLMKSNIEPDIRGEASNEIRHQYLSAQKAKEVLDWNPLFTLEEGLLQTIEWYLKFFSETS